MTLSETPILAAKIKTCKKCGLVFEGRECKPCKAISTKLWRAENADKVEAYRVDYLARNAEKIKGYKAAYRKLNRERENAKARQYYVENRDRSMLSSKKWKEENKDRVKEYCADYHLRNLEKIKENRVARDKADPEKYIAINAKSYIRNRVNKLQKSAIWQANNPEKVRELSRLGAHVRRARKLGSGGKLSRDIAKTLFKLQKGRCACCKKPLGEGFHLDHRVPLALGGMNIDENMQLLTAKCNREKHAKDPIDFMQSRGYLL